jgi:ABC-type Mn2+/Zn2+ transport system permease subunit
MPRSQDQRRDTKADWFRHTHATLTTAWLLMVPIAIATGWISSLIFISARSIYANAASHASAWQASRAETEDNT